MRRLIINRLILVLLVLAPHTVPAQQAKSAPLPLSDLKAPDSAKRRATYESIRSDEEALRQSDVRTALIDLLNRENQQIHKTLVDSKGKLAAAHKYGEEYVEYTAQLADTVAKIADWHDPHQLCVLAETPYNPGSPLEVKLVVEGGSAVVPCLVKIAQGSAYDQNDPFVVRDFDQVQAIPTLIHLAAVTKDLALSIQQQIRGLTMTMLRGDARFAAIMALGRFGSPDMIPILEDIARNDPQWRLLDNGQRRFDGRELAAQAIRSIEERNHLNTH